MIQDGSPPSDGSKNDVLKLRSVSNIVFAPARTCNDSTNSRTVMSADHTNSGIRSGCMFFSFMLIVVEMKFTVPKIDDTPAKCREKMSRSARPSLRNYLTEY